MYEIAPIPSPTYIDQQLALPWSLVALLVWLKITGILFGDAVTIDYGAVFAAHAVSTYTPYNTGE